MPAFNTYIRKENWKTLVELESATHAKGQIINDILQGEFKDKKRLEKLRKVYKQ